jgi:hypothetical protein
VLEGDLTDFTLPDVLRLLSFTSKTGRLQLVGGDRDGRVDLADGRVRDASADAQRLPLARRALGAGLVDGDTLVAALGSFERLPSDLELARALVTDHAVDAGALAELLREQTYDATFDLLRWTSGSFRFSVDRGGSSDDPVLDLAVPVDELLAETDRRLASWPALAERTGDLGAAVSVRRPRSGGEVSLSPEGWTLLSLVDGRRTVGDLVALAGQGEQRTRQALADLLEAGVVEVGAAGGSGPIDRLLRDHAALADRERALTGGTEVSEPASVAEVELEITEEVPAGLEVAADPAPADLVPADVEASADVAVPDDEPDAVAEPQPIGASRGLRTQVRTDRLRTDPTVDEELVTRLIDGVEGL